jgi:hypothetical protein
LTATRESIVVASDRRDQLVEAVTEIERAESDGTYGASLLVGLPADPREGHAWLLTKVALLDALECEIWRQVEATREDGDARLIPLGVAKVRRARAFLMEEAARLFERAAPPAFAEVADALAEVARREQRTWEHVSRLPLVARRPSLFAVLLARVVEVRESRPGRRQSRAPRTGRGPPRPGDGDPDLARREGGSS